MGQIILSRDQVYLSNISIRIRRDLSSTTESWKLKLAQKRTRIHAPLFQGKLKNQVKRCGWDQKHPVFKGKGDCQAKT